MSELRSFATFEASFPDDLSESEDEDEVTPGGRNICVALRGMLQSLGLSVSAVDQYQFYGWEMVASDGKYKYWLMLQGAEPWLLMAEPRGGFLMRKAPAQEALRQLLIKLNAEIGRDARFGDVLWYTPEEYQTGETGGARTP
ncbi:hypothetical protein [Flavisphingomonas formosensis]|uniref:hypothetical protein n=1 Tax=Flavisphingomonas formosensis TaxID=861534 RepID=UPI0012F7DD4D|nr:hypothetical protein [Sphingomonas formosensis]